MTLQQSANSSTWNILRPKTSAARKQFWQILATCMGLVLFVVIFLVFKHHQQLRVEDTWASTDGTVIDLRIVPETVVNSKYGGAVLYGMEVLVNYSANGSHQQRWISVRKGPVSADSAKWLAFRWKGQLCTVRWNPTSPDKPIVELN
jgi:hypothetical protein